MKLMIKRIMITMLIAVFVSASVVMAGEENAEGSSLGDLISGLIPDDVDLSGIVDGVADQLSDIDLGGIVDGVADQLSDIDLGGIVDGVADQLGDIDLGGVVNGLKDTLSNIDLSGIKDTISGVAGTLGNKLEGMLGNVTGEDGSFDAGKITSMIGALFGGTEAIEEEAEENEEDSLGLDYYFSTEYYDEANEAVKRHLEEECKDFREPGDESVFSRVTAYVHTDEERTITMFGYFLLVNYDVDGTDLVMKNGGATTELITLTLNEEGTHDVTDFQVLPEGDDFMESLETVCEELGITTDDYFEALEYNDLALVAELMDLLENHPECERVEYQGELRTREELDVILDQIIDIILQEE